MRSCSPCSVEGTKLKLKPSSAFGVIVRVGPDFSINFLKPEKEKLLFWVCCCFLTSWPQSVVTSLKTYFRRNWNTSCLSRRRTNSGCCLHWWPFSYVKKSMCFFRSFFWYLNNQIFLCHHFSWSTYLSQPMPEQELKESDRGHVPALQPLQIYPREIIWSKK